VIDLSDNEILQLGSFALLKRLRTLILHNNFINSISSNIGRALPFLMHLNMTDNKMDSFAEVDRLSSFKHLETLNLQGNPITSKRNYRLYAIWKIPSLQVLDSQPVKLKERKEAKRLFDSSVGQQIETVIKASASMPQQPTTATPTKPGIAPVVPQQQQPPNVGQIPLPQDP
jgi:U2 small nuclear ribonucleoprotein A'